MPARRSTSSLVPLPTMNSTFNRAERIGDGPVEVDDDDLVVRRERAGQRRSDLPAADDYDAHGAILSQM